jgi:hypothetical protein
MPLEYEKAPTGKDGDNQVISRYSAAASFACIALRLSGVRAASSLTAPTPARRRGRVGLLVVMSMGMAVVMVVTTMLVMVMMVVMMMIIVVVVMICVIVAGVIMRMIVRRVVVRFACRRVCVATTVIGAPFGIEWCLDLDHARAQSLHHRLDDMVAPDTQAPRRDLRRQMAVAEMPGDPNQMLRVGTANFGQRLRRRDDLDQPVVVEHQRVAAAQHGGIFQVEQEFKSARACHRHPPPVAVVEIEHDRIGRRLVPAMLAADLRGADHMAAFPINGRRLLPA